MSIVRKKVVILQPQNDASVAQLVEHLTLNQGVQGSTPCGSTRKPLIFQWLFSLSFPKVGFELFPIFAVSSFCIMRHRFLLCFVLSLLLFIIETSLWAQIPTGYYDNATGKQGDELKSALHDIIKGHTVVSYGGLLQAFAYTDCKENGTIWDIYSNIEYSTSTGLCGEYEQEGDCWNREHTWPQSWFNESTTPRSDLFHVYPTDGFVNGQRSNYPYGEVNNPIYTSGNGSKLGPCVTSGYSGRVFEPVDEYKGDLARTYFYMSVRYSGEDDDWGTSGMTDKSEIKPWAMTMLLRWSEEDPVSQKEIDRNNAVYGYQGNRNPFIDHPEYAHMIWDENWQGGISYNITCATGLSHGSVSAPENALEGSTVSITAIPDAGYMVDTYIVYKTGSPSTTVAVSSNGTFTMPAYAVTVSATFKVNNTYYSITLGSVSHGSINANPRNAKSGTTISLTATPASGYSFYSWYVFKNGDMNTTVDVSGNSFTMPAFNVTVMATFVQGNTNGNYVKVTAAPTDWSGEYLIVYENDSKAFDGSLTSLDAAANTISVTINSHTIEAGSTTNASKFTVASVNGGYSIQSSSGYYIGQTADENGLKSSRTTVYVNSLSYNQGNVDVLSSGGAYLRFNTNSGQERFRYYKSSTYSSQKAIQLYKKSANSATPSHSINFNSNGGMGFMPAQTVNEFEPITLNENIFVRDGFVFDGWNTEADGTGTYYADGATVKLLADLNLYAQWSRLYTITVSDDIANGSVSSSVDQAIEEQTITLTVIPDEGYELDYLLVTTDLGHVVTVTENQFEMPANDVTVSAVFAYVGVFEQRYYLVTDVSQLVAGRTYLIVNTTAGKALGKNQNTNNRSAVNVTVSNNVIASIGNNVCELVLGSEEGYWTFFDANYDTQGGYLYAASSSYNNLKTQATNDANGRWSISFSNGVATIKAQGSNTRNIIKYNANNGTPIFSCYASGQQDVKLFVRSECFEHTGSTTLTCLNTFDRHSVRSGVVLTANKVLGMDMMNETNNLTIDDGAQFIHNVNGVKATMKKSIVGFVGEDGWYTIASPMTNLAPDEANLTDGDFDLYAYQENADLEWSNYKDNGFTLATGYGYLYAHRPNIGLSMSGILNNGNSSETVDLSYASSIEELKGFNLLGNPTAHDIVFTKSQGVSDGYYYLDNGSSWIYTTSNSVPAGRGFLVKANASGQTVTLNPQGKGEADAKGRYLCLSVGDEKVFVELSEGVSMPLMEWKGQHASFYLTQGQQPYSMLVRNGADIIDLCYEARKNGMATLIADTQGLGLDYLHLVDIVAGVNVDLLATPNYSFEAKTTDPTLRFKLVFNAKGNDAMVAE